MRRPLAAPLLAIALLAIAAAAAAQTMLIDRIVVRVNDRIATMIDFQNRLAERRQAILAEPSLTDSGRQQALEEAGREVLTDIYSDLLLLSRADQLAARVTDADVERALATQRERMGLQTEEQMQQALAASGLTEEQLRERMHENLMVQEVMGREVHPRLRVSEDELRRYYREHAAELTNPAAVRLQEVVVVEEEGRDPATVGATARRVHDEIAAGTPVDEVAKKGAADGSMRFIDLGWVNAGDLDSALEEAAWALQPGGVTAPVRGRGGLHVAKVLERREPALRPFDEVKEQIAARLEQTRLASEYPAYLRELEERSYIVLKVPPEAEGFTGLATDSQAPDALQGLRELSPRKPAGAAPGTPTGAAPGKPAQPAPAPVETPPPPSPPAPG